MFKTTELLRNTGITRARLYWLLATGRIPTPRKDCSGHLIWTQAEMEAAAAVARIDHRCRESKEAVNV